MAQITAIHHVCIDTWNIEESLSYYQEKLGFSLIGREQCSFGEYAMLRFGNARIELIQNADKTQNEIREAGPIAHIGFEVDDVEGIFSTLKEKGIVFKTEQVVRQDEPLGGLTACSTVGPSGEMLSFYHFRKPI